MKRISRVGLVIIAISMLLVGCLGGGSGKGYSVSGTIKDIEGNPVPGVSLAFETDGKTETTVAKTDKDGK